MGQRRRRRANSPTVEPPRRVAARSRTRKRSRWLFAAGGAVLFGVAAFLFLRPTESTGGSTFNAPRYVAPVRGDPNAPVTIVEYGDFQCPSCGAFFRGVEPQLIRQYVDTGKAKLVFKHFAWIGQESKDAAQASACAHAQGRFWEFHDVLYANQRGENQGAFTKQNLKRLAQQLSLDAASFNACLDSGAYRAVVDQDFQESRGVGATGTPTFVINGQRVVGAQSFAVFASVIDANLRGQ